MRAYSSRVTPCSAAISGVTRISVMAVAIHSPRCGGRSRAAPLQRESPLPFCSRCRLGGADERFDHRTKYDQAVDGAESGFHGALGMGRESGDVAFAIADPSNVANRAVRVPCVIVGTVGGRVAENHLAILLKVRKSGFVAIIIS